MKNLKLGVIILEGVAALISVGVGVYQLVEIVKTEQAKKALEKEAKKNNAIEVEVAQTN